MGQRITIVMEESIVKKLRFLQSKQIKESSGSVSFSRVVNDALRKYLK